MVMVGNLDRQAKVAEEALLALKKAFAVYRKSIATDLNVQTQNYKQAADHLLSTISHLSQKSEEVSDFYNANSDAFDRLEDDLIAAGLVPDERGVDDDDMLM